jgi:hypothetical protein
MSPDGGIHDKGNKYVLGEKTQSSGLDAQTDFIDTLNNDAFGGFNNWRLPSIKELSTIANKGNNYQAINASYFPNTIGTAYWSMTTYSANGADHAWHMSFDSGHTYHYSKTKRWNVRAVKGGTAA